MIKVRPKQTEEGKTETSITMEELISVAVEVVNERAAQRAASGATDVKGQAGLLTRYLSKKEHMMPITHVPAWH